MRGLIAFNFFAGALAMVAAFVIFLFDASAGRELSGASLKAYAVGIILLLVSCGLWAYRRYYMRRAVANVEPRPISNNMIRRQRRNRPLSKEAFLESLEVNKGIRVNRPELVSQVESCDHPDYQQFGPRGWNCVACSLTVVGNRKPKPGKREII